MMPHWIYISYTSGIKVGITRENRLAQRWIDQGAMMGIAIARVGTRFHSGWLEHQLAQHTADKTNWRTMLRTDACMPAELFIEHAEKIQSLIPDLMPHRTEVDALFQQPIELMPLSDNHIQYINHPRLATEKVVCNSLSLDKTPHIQSKLIGIKGPYLCLTDGVFHVKKHTGYDIQVTLSAKIEPTASTCF